MKRILFPFITVALIAFGWVFVAKTIRPRPVPHDKPYGGHIPFESATLIRDIQNSEQAVKLDPVGALGNSRLSGAYLALSRETDDVSAATKAESYARKSLKLRALANMGASNKIAQALLQQHRFMEALRETELAQRLGRYDDATVRLQAECLIEIGEIDQAKRAILRHQRAFDHASGLAIKARILDLTGNPAQARQLYEKAVDEAEENSGMPSDAIAWFHVRLATQCERMGSTDQAEAHFRRALTLYPRNYRALFGLARLAYRNQQWQTVIEYCQKSDQIAPMVEARSLIGDAYAKLGRKDLAEAAYLSVLNLFGRPSGMNAGLHEAEATAGGHGHRLDRQYALFCADHGRDLEGAYAAALRDLESRHDIYAFDTLAWVLAKRGDAKEAMAAIQRATRLGTQDPTLLYHAGVIAGMNGKPQAAERFFGQVFVIDPKFGPIAHLRTKAELQAVK